MKIITVIPARGGSKSIPHKNIANLGGQPLIGYTILDSIRTKLIEETFVSTDDKDIAEISERFGAEVVMRPPELSTDNASDLQWAWHFLTWYEDTFKHLPELLVHLRATTPIRDLKLITEAIETMKVTTEATSLISVEEFVESPYKWLKFNQENWLDPLFPGDFYLQPKQNVPKAFKPNGYVDILRPEVILKGSLHGDRRLGFITPNVIEIDSPAELAYAEYLISKQD
jgi:N-acylneuraminate cytidylyltransferase